MTHSSKHTLFRSLHSSARPLALANAWDVASARLVEAAGAPAVATTSAGVAWSLGAAVRRAALDLYRVGGYRSLEQVVDYLELNGLFGATG